MQMCSNISFIVFNPCSERRRMKVAVLVLALFAVAYAAPNDNEQDAEVEGFLSHLKLAQEQGVNEEDFLNKLMEDVASEQEDDSSDQDDDEDTVVSEEAAEQDDDKEDEANIQAAILAELQNEDEEIAATLQELARDQTPQAKSQWVGLAWKIGKAIYKYLRRRRGG